MTADFETTGTDALEMGDDVYVVYAESSIESKTDSVEEYFLIAQIDFYFQMNALEQKRLRPYIAESIRNADFIDPYFRTVLEHIGGKVSPSTIIAAIDLLSAVGAPITSFAMRVLRAPTVLDENVLFVLANVVTRRNESWVATLLQSQSRSVREGAIEALAGHEGFAAKSALGKVAKADSSPALRERAMQILEDDF